jgi:hypothetical protein
MLFLVIIVVQRAIAILILVEHLFCVESSFYLPLGLVTSNKQYNARSGVFFTLGTSANFNFIGTQFF